jgi:hypothetical protein
MHYLKGYVSFLFKTKCVVIMFNKIDCSLKTKDLRF